MPDDLGFSIETTTMRLKSLKLRRAEAADKALDQHFGAKVPEPPPAPASQGPVGRVRHDERGMAVWDWAAAAGDTAALSATNVMRKLDVSGLSIEQTQRELKAMEPVVSKEKGSDPYNQHRSSPPGDPFKRGSVTGSDPYNKATMASTAARRPPPKAPAPAAPVKKPGSSVLDQLLGKKK
jgi:hypothetical protein